MAANSSQEETLSMPVIEDKDNVSDSDVQSGLQEETVEEGNLGEEKRGRWERFKIWRKKRPFAGGLLLILSGGVIAAPAYITIHISDLLVMISTVSGVSTLLIGALLIMFGLGAWFRQETATYVGVLGILVAIVALPTSNIGGFVIGSLLGIIGGALTFAWQPRERGRVKG